MPLYCLNCFLPPSDFILNNPPFYPNKDYFIYDPLPLVLNLSMFILLALFNPYPTVYILIFFIFFIFNYYLIII